MTAQYQAYHRCSPLYLRRAIPLLHTPLVLPQAGPTPMEPNAVEYSPSYRENRGCNGRYSEFGYIVLAVTIEPQSTNRS